jgi:hypothetical protein
MGVNTEGKSSVNALFSLEQRKESCNVRGGNDQFNFENYMIVYLGDLERDQMKCEGICINRNWNRSMYNKNNITVTEKKFTSIMYICVC